MRNAVRRFLRHRCRVSDGVPLWVAVSGGVDSMVLMHLLHALGHPLQILHVDHGLRGSDSDADRELVERTAASLGIPCRVEHVDVAAHRTVEGGSLQMAARSARYEAFHRAVGQGPSLLAMAHHADDAVETLLMHLLRGMGGDGWAGIPVRTGAFVRPLLGCSREAIEAYAAEHGIPFRVDASNSDAKYLRNRVRHELIPLMELLRPGARRVLQRNAQLARELHALAQDRLMDLGAAVHGNADGCAELRIDAVEASVAPLLLLMRFTAPARLHPDVLEDILRAIHERHVGARFPGPTHDVSMDREVIVLSPRPDPRPGHWVVPLHPPWPQGVPFLVEQVGVEECHGDQPANVLLLDASAVVGQLRLRPWNAGDRIAPTGMIGTKSVSDLLVDAKVPLHRKGMVQVLEDDRGILWCCGYRRGRLAMPITPPDRLLKLSVGSAFAGT